MKQSFKTCALFTGLIIALGFAGGMDKADAAQTGYMLHATAKVKSFGVVVKSQNASVHVWNESYELPQHYVSKCKASYADKKFGVHVYVTVLNCGGAGKTELQISFLSTKLPNNVELVVGTHN